MDGGNVHRAEDVCWWGMKVGCHARSASDPVAFNSRLGSSEGSQLLHFLPFLDRAQMLENGLTLYFEA
jgi:hypothetical protein